MCLVAVEGVVGDEGAFAHGERIEVAVCTALCGGAIGNHVAQVAVEGHGSIGPVVDTCGTHGQGTIHQRTCPHGSKRGVGLVGCGSGCGHAVGAVVDVLGEGEVYLYYIALLPLAGRDGHIAARCIVGCHLFAIECHLHAFGCPVGDAELHGKLATTFGDAYGAVLGWPCALLLQGDALLVPLGH